MAAPDAANILVAIPAQGTGGVFTAAVGTALPTSATSSLSAYTDCGLISEDGVTSIKEISSEPIRDWGGNKRRDVQTEYARRFQLAFLEDNADILALLVSPGSVETVGSETTVIDDGGEPGHFALVIDTRDGDKRTRYVAADAKVVEQEDVVLVHSDATRYGVTIEVYPDESGVFVKEFHDTGDGS